MNILEIDDKTQWEGFLAEVEQKTFLHSWAWGEFQKAIGEKVWRLGLYKSDELIGVALVIKINARRGKFLFIPQGPIFYDQRPTTNDQRLKFLCDYLEKLVREEKCGFIRISPILEDTKENHELFAKLGFRASPMHMHAELSLLLDISKSEEEILQGMRKTTRNLIRRGEREGVEVREGTLDEFYPLFEETAKRQNFVRFSKKYLKEELKVFGDDAKIFLAIYEGKTLAGAFIVFFDGTTYYHHGASLHSKVPATYALQWEIIKEAKKRGIKQYNFWGVVPENEVGHPWHGLSLFKRGFGGRELVLMSAQDLPLSWKYCISWGIEMARKWKRNY